VRGVKLSDECFVSPLVKSLLDVLSTAEGWTKEYPPSPQQMRYGNQSFRAWHQRLTASAEGKIEEDRLEQQTLLTLDFHARRLDFIITLTFVCSMKSQLTMTTADLTMRVLPESCLVRRETPSSANNLVGRLDAGGHLASSGQTVGFELSSSEPESWSQSSALF
jgi:hypothetical protein